MTKLLGGIPDVDDWQRSLFDAFEGNDQTDEASPASSTSGEDRERLNALLADVNATYRHRVEGRTRHRIRTMQPADFDVCWNAALMTLWRIASENRLRAESDLGPLLSSLVRNEYMNLFRSERARREREAKVGDLWRREKLAAQDAGRRRFRAEREARRRLGNVVRAFKNLSASDQDAVASISRRALSLTLSDADKKHIRDRELNDNQVQMVRRRVRSAMITIDPVPGRANKEHYLGRSVRVDVFGACCAIHKAA